MNQWEAGQHLIAVLLILVPVVVSYLHSGESFAGFPVGSFVIGLAFMMIIISVFFIIGMWIFRGIRKYLLRDPDYKKPRSVPTVYGGIAWICILAFLVFVGTGTGSVQKEVFPVSEKTGSGGYILMLPVQGALNFNIPGISEEVAAGHTNPVLQPAKENTIVRSFPYTVDGNRKVIDLSLSSTANYRSSRSRPGYWGDSALYFRYIVNDTDLAWNIRPILTHIASDYPDRDSQVRAVVSLVQNIPYDHEKAAIRNQTFGTLRTPYEVLYDGKGICSEKSLLLAAMLKEMGYGVAVIELPEAEHMVVGIRSSQEYSVFSVPPPVFSGNRDGTAFALIESTVPSIITTGYYNTTLVNGTAVIKPKYGNISKVDVISDNGDIFTGISRDYRDGKNFEYQNFVWSVNKSAADRQLLTDLGRKYGLSVEKSR